MSIVSDAEELAVEVVPQARGARLALYAGAGLLAALLVGFVAWWIFIHPGQLRQQVGQATVDATLSSAGAGAATDALKIQVVHDREIVRIDATTKEGENAVHSAQGADAPSPAVAAAMHDALCMYGAYAAEPDCAALRGNRESVGPTEPDTGSRPADQ